MDTVSPETRSRIMAAVRSRDTSPERALRSAMHRAGLRFRKHLPLPGRPDAAFVRRKVAVFVDGCFWHGCPEHYRAPKSRTEYWEGKVASNRERDRKADADLAAMGWAVLRFWEHEVTRDLERCLECVLRSLS